MSKPRIRHLAVFARDPEKVAKFYCDIMEMELVHSMPDLNAHFVSDGYITLAILPHRVDGSAVCGINHFGFHVESTAEIAKRLADAGLETPKARPSDRPYAEHRAADPEGNMFDLSEHGFEQEAGESRSKRKVPA